MALENLAVKEIAIRKETPRLLGGVELEQVLEIKTPSRLSGWNTKRKELGLTWKGLKEYGKFVKNYGLIYSWETPGKGGELFTAHKFQTYVPQDTYGKDNLNPDMLGGDGKPIGKQGNGEDIPIICKTMRKYKIDEFPQLIWNVLIRRNMGVVGTRPRHPAQWLKLFSKEHMELALKDKPGVVPVYGAEINYSLKDLISAEYRYLKRKERIREVGESTTELNTEYFTRTWLNILSGKNKSR